ncbi:hypothetical protein [Fluviispira vulneris]|uniref:hypothetical protein n=1 Tax=Fluviispira vulneris TaxID=2763012 RepID=UPI001648A1EF|nr:hypothetical protein [Fluviispira vulneris]
MQQIKAHIEMYNKKYDLHPLFIFLKDSSIDPRKRLAIAPCIAHFAMSFADLNRYVYRDFENIDIFQEIINEHTIEDSKHSVWFLNDIKRLGFDQPMSFAESMAFLWGKDTIGIRRASYDFSACIRYATSFERYIVLEAIEGNGFAFFTATCKAADDLSLLTGEKYIYFGQHHLKMETGHATGETYLRLKEAVDNYKPNDEQREKAIKLIDRSYEIFTRFNDDMYNYASKYNVVDNIIKRKENI